MQSNAQLGMFESSVILYGSKTATLWKTKRNRFESSVILYGSKTEEFRNFVNDTFESSVILYGNEPPRGGSLTNYFSKSGEMDVDI